MVRRSIANTKQQLLARLNVLQRSERHEKCTNAQFTNATRNVLS
jgi:hypothetical protein